jgi:HAD superfamily hydrolase (TIGR01509 family)
MEAVIFDMDGVLIDSEPLHRETDLAMLKRLGIDVSADYLDKYIGVTNPVMWKEILQEFGINKDVDEVLNALLSLKLKLLKKGDYAPIDGVPELLKELYRKKIPVYIASSSSSIFIKEVLKKIGIEKYIWNWVSGENVPKSKPEPDVFLRAAELLGVEPAECVVIEDSKNGVIAAKRAGMKCVGFKNPASGNQDLAKANLVVEKISELTVSELMKL